MNFFKLAKFFDVKIELLECSSKSAQLVLSKRISSGVQIKNRQLKVFKWSWWRFEKVVAVQEESVECIFKYVNLEFERYVKSEKVEYGNSRI